LYFFLRKIQYIDENGNKKLIPSPKKNVFKIFYTKEIWRKNLMQAFLAANF